MFCEKCGNQINENEKFCSKCGAPVNVPQSEAPESKTEEVPKEAPEAGQNALKTAEKVIQAGTEKAKELGSKGKEAFEKAAVGEKVKKLLDKTSIQEKGKKLFGKIPGGKKGKIFLGAGAAVLVLLIILVANAARLNNWAHRTFSSPEKYYQYVEKQTVKEAADAISDIYAESMEHANIFDLGIDGEVSVSVSEDMWDMFDTVSSLARVDISLLDWLKKANLSGEIAMKDSVLSLNASAGANKDSLLSLEFVGDLKNQMMYLGIPELSGTFLGLDAEDASLMEADFPLEEYQTLVKQYLKAMPSKGTVEKLTSKYLKLALKCVDDVKVKKDKTLKAGDVQQSVTRLVVTIDEETAADMARAVLEALAEDKEVEKVIRKMVKIAAEHAELLGLDEDDLDADDIYESFQKGIEEELEDMEDDRYGNDSLEMELFVDGKGVIRGRSIEADGYNVSYSMPVKGSRFGYELEIDDELSLEGNGKVSGHKVSGTFEVSVEKVKLPLEIKVSKFNKSDLLRGRLNGTFELALTDKMEDLFQDVMNISGMGYSRMEEEILRSVTKLLDDFSIVLKASGTDSSADYTLSIRSGKDELLNLGAAIKIGKGSKAKIPSGKSVAEIGDADDLVDWLEDVDWDKVISKYEKTDLPNDILDFLEDIADMIEDGDAKDMINWLW